MLWDSHKIVSLAVTGRRITAAAGVARLQRAVADGVMARLDEIVPVARARILEEQPAYRDMSPSDIEDVTKLLYENFGMVARAMSGQRVRHEELDYVSHHARLRMRSGIPLDAFMRAYRTGFNTFWQECTAEVASQGLSRDAAVDLAQKMSEAMDTLTTHAAADYVREEAHLRDAGERAASDLLETLLRGEVDPARVEPYIAAPGLDPQADLLVVVARAAVSGERLTEALAQAASALGDALAAGRVAPLVVVRDRAVVAVVPAEDSKRALARLSQAREALLAGAGVELFCGLSSPCAGFSQVASAYEQATLAVSRTTAEYPVVTLSALPALQHLLSGATGTTRTLLLEKAQVLRGLGAPGVDSARATLRAFAAANLNVTRAAAALMIHENTLRYRLGRIRERVGIDPTTFDGLLELMCLLEVLDAEAA